MADRLHKLIAAEVQSMHPWFTASQPDVALKTARQNVLEAYRDEMANGDPKMSVKAQQTEALGALATRLGVDIG